MRRSPLRRDPEKARAWEERSREKARQTRPTGRYGAQGGERGGSTVREGAGREEPAEGRGAPSAEERARLASSWARVGQLGADEGGPTSEPYRAPEKAAQSPRDAFADPSPSCRVCGSGRNLEEVPHHVIYRQVVRREGGDEWAPENALRVCKGCHRDHHSGSSRRIPMSALRGENVAWAFTLLGARAYSWLRRRYSGEDRRVDEALAAAESAESLPTNKTEEV